MSLVTVTPGAWLLLQLLPGMMRALVASSDMLALKVQEQSALTDTTILTQPQLSQTAARLQSPWDAFQCEMQRRRWSVFIAVMQLISRVFFLHIVQNCAVITILWQTSFQDGLFAFVTGTEILRLICTLATAILRPVAFLLVNNGLADRAWAAIIAPDRQFALLLAQPFLSPRQTEEFQQINDECSSLMHLVHKPPHQLAHTHPYRLGILTIYLLVSMGGNLAAFVLVLLEWNKPERRRVLILALLHLSIPLLYTITFYVGLEHKSRGCCWSLLLVAPDDPLFDTGFDDLELPPRPPHWPVQVASETAICEFQSGGLPLQTIPNSSNKLVTGQFGDGYSTRRSKNPATQILGKPSPVKYWKV